MKSISLHALSLALILAVSLTQACTTLEVSIKNESGLTCNLLPGAPRLVHGDTKKQPANPALANGESHQFLFSQFVYGPNALIHYTCGDDRKSFALHNQQNLCILGYAGSINAYSSDVDNTLIIEGPNSVKSDGSNPGKISWVIKSAQENE